jgi:cathepsin B
MTDRLCIGTQGKKTDHLSAQDVTSCCKLEDMGCNGGVPSTVYSYYHLQGIVTGGQFGDKSGCWSYQLAPCAHHVNGTKYPACADSGKAPACARKCTDNTALKWDAQKTAHHGQPGYSVCGNNSTNSKCSDAMAQEIYQNGPVTGMFFVHQSFTTYKSGVYKKKLVNDPMLGGHAIKIMGFGTENGEDYWLVANSWNDAWGMDGYFKIARGHNECQMEDPVINGGPVAGLPTKI